MIATMTLGPGAWAISGKVEVASGGAVGVGCHLFASDTSDFDTSDVFLPAAGSIMTLPMEIQHTTGASTWTVRLGCFKFAAGTVDEENAAITAIKLGSETHTVAN